MSKKKKRPSIARERTALTEWKIPSRHVVLTLDTLIKVQRVSFFHSAPPRLLPTVSFQDLVTRAENGDAMSAKGVVNELAAELSAVSACDSTKRKSWSMPGDMVEYLAKVFVRIDQGMDANKALYLKKKSGTPAKWTHFQKRLGAKLVRQFLAQGRSVFDSAADAADQIKAYAESDSYPPEWVSFHGKTVKAETLATWYYDDLNKKGDLD